MSTRVAFQFPWDDHLGHKHTHWHHTERSIVPCQNEVVEINLTYLNLLPVDETDGEPADVIREYRVKDVMHLVPPRDIDEVEADVLVELW